MIDNDPIPLSKAMWRGFLGKCPNCGKGKLFRAYLKPVDSCAACGEEYHQHQADDAPPYFTILIVGHLIVAPLLFALLPLALIVAGYFYVTGGTVMSTDNAYVQADMVGLSTDVSGIVREVLVHDNQQVAKGDVLFKLDDLQFRLALDPALKIAYIVEYLLVRIDGGGDDLFDFGGVGAFREVGDALDDGFWIHFNYYSCVIRGLL